ncbi:MAG: hypothetical protein M3413_13110 [Bacteroidota bacterium]|nr:hypothetical protein [Bacteroidota bacterium]
MIQDNDKKNNENSDSAFKPDPETLHKTDPQENMEGPVSSLIKSQGEAFKTDETKEEADEEKEKEM